MQGLGQDAIQAPVFNRPDAGTRRSLNRDVLASVPSMPAAPSERKNDAESKLSSLIIPTWHPSDMARNAQAARKKVCNGCLEK